MEVGRVDGGGVVVLVHQLHALGRHDSVILRVLCGVEEWKGCWFGCSECSQGQEELQQQEWLVAVM